MTELPPRPAPRRTDHRRPRQLLPGPLMELIRGIREAEVGDVLAVCRPTSGSRTDIPMWVEKAGHRLIAVVDPRGYDEIVVQKAR